VVLAGSHGGAAAMHDKGLGGARDICPDVGVACTVKVTEGGSRDGGVRQHG
jgi:hypothetical protein